LTDRTYCKTSCRKQFDWEQRKLGELVVKGGSGGTPTTSNAEYYMGNIPFLSITDISSSNGYIYDTEKHITEEALNSSAAWIVPSESIALAMYASVGKVAILKQNIATSQAFYNMVIPEITTRDYIYQYLKKLEEFSEWDPLISTGTQANLNAEKVKNLLVNIPKEILEQKEIGATLNFFDHLITLHQRKLEKEKSLKKSLLSEMFPAEDERKPRRRFPGFTGDWEQRKLGEVAEITMGQSPDGSTYSGVPSGNILIQGNADLQDGWVIPRVWTTQVTKKAEAGDLIMSVRAPAGTIGKTAYDAVIGRGVAAIKGNEFMYQMLLKMDNDGYWKAFSSGSTFESLNSDNIRNAEIIIPKEKEQQLVGSVLNNLDHLITLHQRKLEKHQNLKKAYLNEMFIELEA
jgi:type I restriction enzyme S subunit